MVHLESTKSLDEITLEVARERMIHHPVFRAIHSVECLRTFMEAHVFAVWDFMSLLKRLQRELTCVDIPWIPRPDTQAALLVNQIVLGEETDIGPTGEPTSHLALYLTAMQEVGAGTAQFEIFQSALADGSDLSTAFALAEVQPFVRAFTNHTLQTAREGSLLEVMASFLYGRENVIPRMFGNLLETWDLNESQAPTFVYYLKRHIEIDGGEHGPAAEAILSSTISNNAERSQLAMIAAHQSVVARIKFWDGVLASLV